MILSILLFILLFYIINKKLDKEEERPVTLSSLPDISKVTFLKSDTDFSVKLVEPKLDISKLLPYQLNKKTLFRPETLEEYVGQENAKNIIRLNIEKIKTLKPVHIIIDGDPGHGKTTIAKIIGKILDADWIERIASQIKTEEDIITLFQEINNSQKQYTILFLDEIHTLQIKPELFYTAMEDYQIGGVNIKPFILIGATTEKNILAKKARPFLDRFHVHLRLSSYTKEDIIEIIKQYKEKLYPKKKILSSNYDLIAMNCKFTPRIAISLLEDNLVESDFTKILTYRNIVRDGLDIIDIEILKLLYDTRKSIGEEAISTAIGISKADYKSLYEPYLTRYKYLIRSRLGRIITNKGIELLESLK